MSVAVSVTGYNATAAQAALALAVSLGLAPPYCSPNTTAHWAVGQDLTWAYPSCVAYLSTAEVASAGRGSALVRTHVAQTSFARACGIPAAVLAPPAGNLPLPASVDPQLVNATLFAFPSTNCSTTQLTYASAYVFQPESVVVTFTPTFSTSWGARGTFSSLTMPGGYSSTNGSLSLPLSAFLAAAGVSLDSPNTNVPLASPGSLPWISSPSAATPSPAPPFRTTGLVLRATVQASNYRVARPSDFSYTAEIHVQAATSSEPVLDGPHVTYTGALPLSFDSSWTERRYSVVELGFAPGGLVGTADAFAAITALLAAFVVSLVAVALTDCAGQQISDEFASEKYEDDGERAALDALLQKEADHRCETFLNPESPSSLNPEPYSLKPKPYTLIPTFPGCPSTSRTCGCAPPRGSWAPSATKQLYSGWRRRWRCCGSGAAACARPPR